MCFAFLSIYLRFNGRTGWSYMSDMALDDVSFSQFAPPPLPPSPPPPPPTPPPPSPPTPPPLLPGMVQLSCDFKVDTCAWIDTTPDGYSWTRGSGGTSSSDTGPSGDHPTGSGYYLYTGASGVGYTGGSNKLHQLESPLFSLQQDATLSFFYHMHMHMRMHMHM